MASLHSPQKVKSNEIKKGVCFHEAGHWVVARHLGFKVGEVKITITKDGKMFGHNGSSKIFPRLQSNSKKSIEEYLKNRIAVLFSGVIAQALSIANKSESTARDLLRSDGSDDYKTINELFYLLRGVCHPDEAGELDEAQLLQLQKECWEHSDQIVQTAERDIATLAQNMAKEIVCMNQEYIFKLDKLAGWLPNPPLNTDPPPHGVAPVS